MVGTLAANVVLIGQDTTMTWKSIREKVTVDAKVDLQTQRAKTRFNVKACQPI